MLYCLLQRGVEVDGIPISKLEPKPVLDPFPQLPPFIIDALPHPNKSKVKREIHEVNEDESNVSRKRYCMTP